MRRAVIPEHPAHDGGCESRGKRGVPCLNWARVVFVHCANDGAAYLCERHAEGFLTLAAAARVTSDWLDPDSQPCLPRVQAALAAQRDEDHAAEGP